MYRVDANSEEEYFTADPGRESDLRAVDRLIRETVPGLGRYFSMGTPDGKPGMNMRMIGYGKFQYYVKSAPEPIDWPIIGLALQKNYISLYFSTTADGRDLVEPFGAELGKVNIAKNLIRFKTVADLDERTFVSLLKVVESDIRNGAQTRRYGRVA